MFTIFLVLIAIVCFLLIVVIMVQNPKGGGLSSTMGGSTQIGGVQKTTDFLDKSTWALATTLIVLILLSSLSFNTGEAITPVEATETPAATEAPATETPAAKPATSTATPVEAPATEPAKK